jgi:site-specific DNA-methyltransferase (adenine-specific)
MENCVRDRTTLLTLGDMLPPAQPRETLTWTSKSQGSPHIFNYDLINSPNPTGQISSVWPVPSGPRSEKRLAYHPTQEPLRLVRRALLASTHEGDLVFDTFCTSGATGVAAKERNRACIGAGLEREFAGFAERRIQVTERGGLFREIAERSWSDA